MRTMQLRGPFYKDTEYPLLIEGTFYQIGLEIGRTYPFTGLYNFLKPVLNIKTKNYNDNGTDDVIDDKYEDINVNLIINDTCVLEWDNIQPHEVVITPLIDLDEYTIIDIAYATTNVANE